MLEPRFASAPSKIWRQAWIRLTTPTSRLNFPLTSALTTGMTTWWQSVCSICWIKATSAGGRRLLISDTILGIDAGVDDRNSMLCDELATSVGMLQLYTTSKTHPRRVSPDDTLRKVRVEKDYTFVTVGPRLANMLCVNAGNPWVCTVGRRDTVAGKAVKVVALPMIV